MDLDPFRNHIFKYILGTTFDCSNVTIFYLLNLLCKILSMANAPLISTYQYPTLRIKIEWNNAMAQKHSI